MPRVGWRRTLWRSNIGGNISSNRLKPKLSNRPPSRYKHLLPRWAAILDNELHNMVSLHLVLHLLLLLHPQATDQRMDSRRDRQQLLLLPWVRRQSQAIDQRRATDSSNSFLLSRLMPLKHNLRLHRLLTKPPSLHTISTPLLLNSNLRHTINSRTRRLNLTTLSALLLYTDTVMPMMGAVHLLNFSNPLCNHPSNRISLVNHMAVH